MTDDYNPPMPVRNGGSRPVPDPTELTDRAIARLEKALTSYIDGQLAIRDERLSGIDEATKLRLQSVTDIPDQIREAVANLEKLMAEKFDASERLRVEQKKDTKDAVDAALNAAKEAVKEQTASSEKSINKSETSTGAQIKQLQETFATAIEALRRSLDDLKDREIEDVRGLRQAVTDVATTANGQVQRQVGVVDNRQDHTDSRVALYTTIGLVVSLVIAAVAIVGFVVKVGG